jgi:hypothetical protein
MSGPDSIESELAALADGTLQGERREQLLVQVADSPELATELERQHRALALVGTLDGIHAPMPMRRSIEALAAAGSPPAAARPASVGGEQRRPRRLRLQAGLALAAAAVAIVVLVALSGGGSSSHATPTLLQASSTGLRPARRPAPRESSHNSHLLTASAEGITFPYWESLPPRPHGWTATGARTDTVGGRTVTTVFYGDHADRRIGYSIVSGSALPIPTRSTTIRRSGMVFHTLKSRGATVVTWRERGHTCILTARAVTSGTLVHLASWRA